MDPTAGSAPEEKINNPVPTEPNTVPQASADVSPPVVDPVTDSVPPMPVPDVQPQPSTQPQNKKSGLKWLIFIFVLLALAAGGYAFWKHYYNKPTLKTATTMAKKDIPLIRYGAGEGNMNEFYPTMTDNDTTRYVNRQIFEGLVTFQEKTKIVPLLATSWANPDSSTWLFTLKSNVRFHTGKTMTAKDVVYSYQQLNKNPSYSDGFSTIKTIEAVGDNQVKIVTKGVDPILLNRLTGLVIMDSAAAGKADPLYGTGSYKVKDGTKPTASEIDLVAFDNYHGGHVYTRELQVKVYVDKVGKPGSAEEAMFADTKAGKLDIVGFVTGTRLTEAKTANYQLFPVDDVSVYSFTMNTVNKSSPLSNLKIRQAIYDTIDVAALLKAIGRDGTIASQPLPSFIPGFNPAITRPKRDVEAAKKLVKDAGYPNGANITLTVYSPAQDAGQEIVRQLKEVGINVKLNIGNDVAVLQAAIADAKLESFYYAVGSSFGDGSDALAQTLQNKNYSNAQATTLLDQANKELSPTKRLELLKQVSKLGMDDVAIVPLYINKPTWVASQPYVMSQDMLSSDLGVFFYKVHLN